MLRAIRREFLFCLFMAAMPGLSLAQSFVLDLPAASQRADISQRIGLTEVTIHYHRPLAKDRKIWNGLVPGSAGTMRRTICSRKKSPSTMR